VKTDVEVQTLAAHPYRCWRTASYIAPLILPAHSSSGKADRLYGITKTEPSGDIRLRLKWAGQNTNVLTHSFAIDIARTDQVDNAELTIALRVPN
jgi:hypothetical protein